MHRYTTIFYNPTAEVSEVANTTAANREDALKVNTTELIHRYKLRHDLRESEARAMIALDEVRHIATFRSVEDDENTLSYLISGADL